MLGTLTCGDTVDNADAMDPLDTRRLRQDAGSSRRKGGSSSWTWERYFLQQNTMLLIIPYLSEQMQITVQYLQLKRRNLFAYIYFLWNLIFFKQCTIFLFQKQTFNLLTRELMS